MTSKTSFWGRLQRDELEQLSREELLAYIYQEIEEGISISFAGKNTARQLARKVQPRVSKSVAKYSHGDEEDQARNTVIEGENLQAMATLYRERGKVNMILTDPPYNTGRDFRYNDRWEDDPNDAGIGEFVPDDDPARHTKWMRFMLPRIRLMHEMLKEDGVLAICIDHRELFHLGQMLDEVFGAVNRLAILNWQKSYSPRADNSHVSTATEYVLIYAKNEEFAKTNLLPRTEEMDDRYKSPDGDPHPWKASDAQAGKPRENMTMVYAIQSPFTGELHYPKAGTVWRVTPKDMQGYLEGWGVKYERRELDDAQRRADIIGVGEDEVPNVKAFMLAEPLDEAKQKANIVADTKPWPRIWFGKRRTGRPQWKRYLHEVKQGVVPTTYWADDDYDVPLALGSTSWAHPESGHSQTGADELTALVGDDHGFKTVKPLKLFYKLLQIWCPPDGLVFDPFAGSGTTGHAVLHLNAESGASRRFILVEQGRPDRGDSYARGLLADRLRRAATGDWAAGQQKPLGGGWSFLHLRKRVDAQALLSMEREDMTDAVIASYFARDSGAGQGGALVRIPSQPDTYLVARNAYNEGVFLVWDGADASPVFDEEVYDAVVDEAKKEGLAPRYHVYARFNLHQSSDVVFYQIPNRILLDFGLSVTTDAYNVADEGDE